MTEPTGPQQRMAAHTSIELRQAAASTNLVGSIIADWGRGHGFHEDWDLAQWLATQAKVLENTDAGETCHSHAGDELAFHEMLTLCAEVMRNNIISGKLMLIVSEVAEAMETLRDTGFSDILSHGNFGEELADIEIRVKHLAAMLKIDLGQIEVDKIRANAERPYKHGRKM
jgi:NTP pyrophosphatase (non-canonical NTP hydrolase)